MLRAFLFSLCLVPAPALAEDDLFAFIPLGGRTILMDLLVGQPDAAAVITKALPAAEWGESLANGTAGLEGSAALDDQTRRTLADYLAYAAPIADPEALPWDGRDMALARCQSCHIITVTVTQDRPREQWLGTFSKPSHVGVALTEAEREQLADYLAVNAGIPIDDIPPELRAGGATY
jgi:mono/diheme cytochrome c family protein